MKTNLLTTLRLNLLALLAMVAVSAFGQDESDAPTLKPAEGVELNPTVKVGEQVTLKVELEGVEDQEDWKFVWKKGTSEDNLETVEEGGTYVFSENTDGTYYVQVTAKKDEDNIGPLCFQIMVEEPYLRVYKNDKYVPFLSEADNRPIKIESNVDWKVDEEKTDIWIKAEKNSETSLQIYVEKNEKIEDLQGKVVLCQVGGELADSVIVTQKGTTPSIEFEELENEISAEGGTFEVKFSSNIGIVPFVIEGEDWLSYIQPKDENTLEFKASPNTTSERRTAKILAEGNGEYKAYRDTVTVTQEASSKLVLEFSKEIEQEVEKGKTIYIEVKAKDGSDLNDWTFNWSKSLNGAGFEPIKDATTAKHEFKEEQLGVYIVAVTATKDGVTTDSLRTPIIKVIDLIVPATTVVFKAEGETKNISIDGNVEWEVDDSNIEPWMSVNKKADSTLTITVAPYEDPTERPASITIKQKDGSLTRSFNILQRGKDAYINVQDSLSVPSEGGQFEIEVSSNINWKAVVEEGKEWLEVVRPKYGGVKSEKIQIKLFENTTYEPRTAKITVEGSGVKEEITITQDPAMLQLKIIGETKAIVGTFTSLKVVAADGKELGDDWTFTWKINGEEIQEEKSSSYEFKPESPGIYHFEVTAIKGTLKSEALHFDVKAERKPELMLSSYISQPIEVNMGESIDLEVVAKDGSDLKGWTFSWKNGEQKGRLRKIKDVDSNFYQFTPQKSGKYYFEVTADSAKVKTAPLSFDVAVKPVLKSAVGDSQSVETGTSISLEIVATDGTDLSDWTFNWSRSLNGAGFEPIVGATSAKHEFKEDQFGDYVVAVTATDEDGVTTDTLKISIKVLGLIVPATVLLKQEGDSKLEPIDGNVEWDIESVESSDDWLKAGKDDTFLVITASENKEQSVREGTITIQGEGLTRVINVRQGGLAPYLSVADLLINDIKYTGEPRREIAVSSNLSWTVSVADGEDWLTVLSPTEAVEGSGTIEFTVAKNPTHEPRTATIHVEGTAKNDSILTRDIIVTQEAKPEVTPLLVNVDLSTSDKQRTYTSGDEIILEASIQTKIKPVEDGEWVFTWSKNETPIPNETDSTYTDICQDDIYDNLIVTYTVVAEYKVDEDVYFWGHSSVTLTIEPKSRLEVEPNKVEFEKGGGEQKVQIKSDKAWNAQLSDKSWLKISREFGNKGEEKLTLEAAPNVEDNSRSDTITFQQIGGDLTATLVVIQYGNASLDADPDIIYSKADGGKDTIDIKSNVEWTLGELKTEWILIEDSTKTDDGGSIIIAVEKNDLAKERRDTIIVYSVEDENLRDEVIVVQDAGEVTLEADPEELEVDAVAANVEITITSNVEWNLSTDADWLTVTPTSGGNEDEVTEKLVTIAVAPNEKTEHRTDIIFVTGGERTLEIKVTQKARAVNIARAEGLEETYFVAQNESVELRVVLDEDEVEPAECAFTWMVEGPEGEESVTEAGKLENSYSFAKSGEYTVSVYATKGGVNSDIVAFRIIVLQRPPKPGKLVRKGNGDSHIMIASMNSDVRETSFEYVFGYTTKDGDDVKVETTSNRYCQYQNVHVAAYNDSNVKHWVYTLWKQSGRDVESEKCYLAEGANARPNKVVLSRGRLVGQVDEPTPAHVAIVSLDGSTKKTAEYGARTIYDEQVDLSGLPAGIYVIKATVGDHSTEEKLVIK